MNFRKIKSDSLVYAWSQLLTWGVSGFIIARMLGPYKYGLWSLISLLLFYGKFLHGGVFYALVREIPYFEGKNDSLSSERVKNTAFTVVFLIYSITACVLILSTFFFIPHIDGKALLLTSVFLLLINFFYEYTVRYFMAINDFKAVSILEVISAVLVCCLTYVGCRHFGLYGALWAAAIGRFSGLCIVGVFKKLELSFAIDRATLRRLFVTGVHMFVVVVLCGVFLSVDQMCIAIFLSKPTLALYGLASTAAALVLVPAGAYAKVVYVAILKGSGEARTGEEQYSAIHKTVLISSSIWSVCAAGLFFLIPVGIQAFLPKYVDGIATMQALSLGAGALSFFYIPQVYFFTRERWISLMWLLGSLLVVKIALVVYCILGAYDIAVIARVVSVFHFGMNCGLLFWMYRDCSASMVRALKLTAAAVLPYVYMIGIVVFMSIFLSFMSIMHCPKNIAYALFSVGCMALLVPILRVARGLLSL